MSTSKPPAWRGKLQPASFRGAQFFTRSTAGDLGRRTVLHEYPQRDYPYAEDMGRKARGFTLEAYVIGPDYMAARDKLIAALEQPGSGTLVHPYRGTLTVALASPARITESADEGGMARFSLSFVEAGENAQPTVRADTAALVNAQADNALAAVQNDFASKFTGAGFQDFVAAAAGSVLTTALGAVNAVNRFGQGGDLVAEFLHSASTISATLTTLIGTPLQLAGAVIGQIGALRAMARAPFDAFNNLRGLFNAGDEPAGTPPAITVTAVPVTTPSRIQQAVNQAAVVDLVRRAALVEATRTSSQMNFSSYDEAQAVRTELADRLDAEMASTTLNSAGQSVPIADDVYAALAALRVAMVMDISTRGANLVRLTTATLQATLPALVAAWRIYGDATMDADLVARNKVRHPGFVPGGMPLEVLA